MGDGGGSCPLAVDSCLLIPPSSAVPGCSPGTKTSNTKRNETHFKCTAETESEKKPCKTEDEDFQKIDAAHAQINIRNVDNSQSNYLLKTKENFSVFRFTASELGRVYGSHLLQTQCEENVCNYSNQCNPESIRPVAVNGHEEFDSEFAHFIKPSKRRNEKDTSRFQQTSFDCPKTKRECALKSCPSLDSSLPPSLKPLNEKELSNFHCIPSSSPLLDPCIFIPVPRTPSTPASVIASQASLDSGVLSAHSFDLSQNGGGIEASIRRRRTASSISSGISEVWQSSLDGDPSLTMEAVSEALNTAKSCFLASQGSSSGISPTAKPSAGQKGYSNKLIDSVLNLKADNPTCEQSVADFSSLDEIFVGSRPSAHVKVDHIVLPETSLKLHDVSPSVIFSVASEDVDFPVTNESDVSYVDMRGKGLIPLMGNKFSHKTQQKIEKFAMNLVILALNEAYQQSESLGWSIKCSGQCNQELCREEYKKKNSRENKEKEVEKSLFSTIALSSCSSSLCWTPELPFSPSHHSFSRVSKRSSFSFSHDSLVGGTTCPDDSHLIKGAVSHEALVFSSATKKTGLPCRECLDNDIYTLPVDVVKPYQGRILQPKVIVQQPKRRYLSRNVKLNKEKETGLMVTSKRSKKKETKHGGQRNKNNSSALIESTNKSMNLKNASNGNVAQVSKESNVNGVARIHKTSDVADCSIRHRKEPKCPDQGKLCRIIPFPTSKPHKRKEFTDTKTDRKKGRSLSSNIRNTLITLFSFKRSQKEHGSCINAKNEFIDASSQGFFDSSDGLKWGKICPLPSAPPLRTCAKYSAFTDHVGSVPTTTKHASHNKKSNSSESKPAHNSQTNHSNHLRQSNSISPASLLSCLGHPRTNSIDEQERRARTRPPTESFKHTIAPTPHKTPTLVTQRALPPVPPSLRNTEGTDEGTGPPWKPHTHDKLDEGCDFASIIQKVKNYGWYWGPISGEAAEKVLSNEPDGSFIVRDSSDYHYIFSLTFRLNGVTRHVRIEHDQGNFSFGGFTRFKSQTIVDFIEKAVEHSRSGRYLFFLHRRPVLGPMRVQLLHPVSRFKHVQSLQHLCRFVIVKQVRKDLIHDLPLPQRLKDYLNSPHYYSEQVEHCMTSTNALTLEGAVASPQSRRIRSPSCLRLMHTHTPSTHQTKFGTDLSAAAAANPGLNICPNRDIAVGSSSNGISVNLRCSFNEPGPSVGHSRRNRSRDFRLSSSHSSLENSLLHTYPISPSTLSSESNSGRPSNISFNSKFRRKKSTTLLSGSSHSSPSSPVPFDYSPPDWLSSSEELFQVSSSAIKVPALVPRPICRSSSNKTDDNFFRLAFNNGRLRMTTPEPRSSEDDDSPPQTVTESFGVASSRNRSDSQIAVNDVNELPQIAVNESLNERNQLEPSPECCEQGTVALSTSEQGMVALSTSEQGTVALSTSNKK